ncbi:MAG TPA: glycosyltransferase family 87 protein [Vicinamibacterales bacterium]|nr:glycosyltransferase family 87 protein [Vicinamibacterales bacterium]
MKSSSWRPLALLILGASLLVPRVSAALADNAVHDQQDFGIFYRSAGCVVRGGCSAYPATEQVAPNLAPPHALMLVTPLLPLAQPVAYIVFLLCSTVVLAMQAWRVTRTLGLVLTPLAWLATAAVVGSSGVMESLITSGNIYAFLAWPAVSAWRQWRRGNLLIAGVWLGVIASCKVLVFLALFYFVVHGAWRAALAMVGTAAAIVAIGVAGFGSAPYAAWLEMLSRAPMSGQFHDASIMQTLLRWLTPTMQFVPIADAAGLVRPIWAAAAGLVATLAVTVPRRAADAALLAVLSAALLASPIGWILAAWWLIAPAVAVWLIGGSFERAALSSVAVLLWLPSTLPLAGQPSSVLTLTVGSLNFWCVMTLLLVAVAAGRRGVKA